MKPVSFLGRFLATVERYGLLPQGSRVLVAVSGGPDSVCLLDLLRVVARRLELQLQAFHLNHRLRPTAARDERFVRRLCAEWGVQLTVVRSNVAAYARRHHLGLEAAGRELRSYHLERIAQREGCDRIALGHTADDNLETMLLNLARGAGGRGLSGIPVMRGKIVRPLIDIERAGIVNHLRARKVAWVEDESNRDLRFRRNRVRQELVPLLKRVSPAVVQNARRAAELLADEDRFLDGLAQEALKRLAISRRNRVLIDSRKFTAYNICLRRRMLRQLFPTLNANDVERVIRLSEARVAGRLVLSAGIRVQVQEGVIQFCQPAQE